MKQLTSQEKKDRLKTLIGFWKYKLSANNYLLDPATQGLIRETISFLGELDGQIH